MEPALKGLSNNIASRIFLTAWKCTEDSRILSSNKPLNHWQTVKLPSTLWMQTICPCFAIFLMSPMIFFSCCSMCCRSRSRSLIALFSALWFWRSISCGVFRRPNRKDIAKTVNKRSSVNHTWTALCGMYELSSHRTSMRNFPMQCHMRRTNQSNWWCSWFRWYWQCTKLANLAFQTGNITHVICCEDWYHNSNSNNHHKQTGISYAP